MGCVFNMPHRSGILFLNLKGVCQGCVGVCRGELNKIFIFLTTTNWPVGGTQFCGLFLAGTQFVRCTLGG